MAHISGEPATSEIAPMRPPDGWDQWCIDRDSREDQAAAASARYVPREMVGYEDLGDNGVWSEVPDYGPVWAPRVPVGWAPYHYGHWAWVEPWGWTWIDDAPWGFAPFHYGRWAFVGGGWVWVPGAMVARPVYAPALVAFVGGPRFSMAVGIGGGAGVAWFPLGPREVYVPAYRVSPMYVRQVNITHVTNITTVTNVRYVNQTVPGAVIGVSQRTFAGAQPVGRSAVVVSREEISRAEVVQVAPVAPNREAILGRAGAMHASQPPARIQGRTVVARATPPPAQVPFASRQQALQANPGRPLDQGTLNNLRSNAPAANPRVRQAGGSVPGRVNTPDVTNPAPRRLDSNVDRPNSDRPNVLRPGVDRPVNPGRPPANGEQPRNVERPANVERPRSAERPAATERPAPQEVRRDASQERRQERRSEAEERSKSQGHAEENRRQEEGAVEYRVGCRLPLHALHRTDRPGRRAARGRRSRRQRRILRA